jgi:hypothetical protein
MSAIRPTFLSQLQILQEKAQTIAGPWQISTARQEADLASLRNGHERFSFVVDLQNMQLLHQDGIQRWLGYTKPLDIAQYFSLLHPAIEAIHFAYAHTLLEKLIHGEMQVSYMTDKFVTMHAIRNSDGAYVRVKRVSSAFQLNQRGQMSAYLNEFTLTGPYHGEPFDIWASNLQGGTYPDRLDLIRNDAMGRLEASLPFDATELRLLRYRAHNPAATSNEAVARLIHMSEGWVKAAQSKIKQKAEQSFRLPFNDIHQIAGFLRAQSLV